MKTSTNNWKKILTSASSALIDLVDPRSVNPVTGEKQLMLLDEEWEIEVDKEFAPRQFALDYGRVQDDSLNAFLQLVGGAMAKHTHRPEIPYSFQAVNASSINAYAFPGGSIAVTRGILLLCENEAELAAVLGHELGHVNARHTAVEMSKNEIVHKLLSKAATCAGNKNEEFGNMVSHIASFGAGALLASYSRDNELEADKLGMRYMAHAGYGVEGYVTFMETLNSLNQDEGEASALFSSHPMNKQRYERAVNLKNSEFSEFIAQPVYRERFMDHTAGIRKLKPAIDLFRQAEESIAQHDFESAEVFAGKGLKHAPNDYAGLLIMAICSFSKPEYEKTIYYSKQAGSVYPQETRPVLLNGLAKIGLERYDEAVSDFTAFEDKLPGVPENIFYRGYAYECMGKKHESIKDYCYYLQQVPEGGHAGYAYLRLVEWGVIDPHAD
jgi:hypothetical protein